jgi:hypothetical protein
MTIGELISIASVAFGIGSGGVALYIRSKISETIISRLNGRYVGSGICAERHLALTAQLSRMEHRSDQFTNEMRNSFSSLQTRLFAAQVNRDDIVREQIVREHRVEDQYGERSG